MTDSVAASFVLCTYNQQAYVREAVLSALAQDYEPLEIIITDDCSPDRTFEIIKDTIASYKGGHQVILNRNPTNVGLAGNLNRGFSLCHGELIIVQAGDDVSLPGRSSALIAAYMSREPRPDLVFSNVAFMDKDGSLIKINTSPCDIPTMQQVIRGRFFIAGGMACAYSRQMLDFFGPLDANVVFEDYVLTFRALARNGILHVPSPLVNYRVHETSILNREKMDPPTREKASRYAACHIAQSKARYDAWKLSGHRNLIDGLLLRRGISFQKANALSCKASRLQAFMILLWALLTVRPSFARMIANRDILRKYPNA